MATNTSQLDIIVRAQDETTVRLKSIESSIIRFVGAVSSVLATITVTVFPIKAAADLQKELLNVAKTTNFTDVQISSLNRSLVELSSRINISVVDLAKIAAIAGQLGLGGEGVAGIAQFTETTARFASVINVSVEEAGNGLAKLLNIFKINVKEVEKISSLLNELSNNSTASGADLLDIINRIGTAGGTLNIKQAAALSALGKDLGLTTETVGTSFQKVFLALQTNAAELATTIGLPVQKFAAAVKEDGIGALKLAIDAVRKLDASVQATFSEKVFGGGKIFGLFTNLLNDKDFQLLDKHLASARLGFEGGTSSIKEMDRVSQGLLFQIQLIGNAFSALAIEVGKRAIPSLTEFAKSLQDFLKDPEFINKVVAFGNAIGSIALSVINAGKAIFELREFFVPLLVILEGIIALKIVNVIFSIGSGLLAMAANARTATAAFIALATGQKTLAAASATAGAASGAASGVALSPTVGKTGAFIGAPAAASRAQEVAALEVERTLLLRMAQQRRDQINSTRAIATEQADLNAKIAVENALLNSNTKVKASTLAYHRNEVVTQQANVAALQQQVALRAAIHRQAVATAIADAAAANSASRSVIQNVGVGITGAFRSLGAAIATAAGFIFKFLGPLLLIVGVLELIGALQPVLNFFKRLVGVTDEATAKAEIAANAREKAAEIEKEKIAQLADQYDRMKGIIEGVKASDLEKAITSGNTLQFLADVNRNLDLVRAKIVSMRSEIASLENNKNVAGKAGDAITPDIARQQQRVKEIEDRLKRVTSFLQNAATSGQEAGSKAAIANLEVELAAANKQLEDLITKQGRFYDAKAAFTNRQSVLNADVARVQQVEIQQAGNLLALVNDQTDGYLAKAIAVAKAREEAERAATELQEAEKRSKLDTKDTGLQAAVIDLRQKANETSTVFKQLNRDFLEGFPVGEVRAKALFTTIGDGSVTASAKLEGIRKSLSELSSEGGGKLLGSLISNTISEVLALETKMRGLITIRDTLASKSAAKPLGLQDNRQLILTNGEIVATQSLIVQKKAELQLVQQRQAAIVKEQQLRVGQLQTDKEFFQSQIASGIAIATTIEILKKAQKAQEALRDSAQGTAALYKGEFTKAVSEAAAAIEKTVERVIALQQRIKENVVDLKLVKLDEVSNRREKDIVSANDAVTSAAQEQIRLSQSLNENKGQLLNRLLDIGRTGLRQFEIELDFANVTGARRQTLLTEYAAMAGKIYDIYVTEAQISGATNELNTSSITRLLAQEKEKNELQRKGQNELVRGQAEYNGALEKAAAAQALISAENVKQVKIRDDLATALENNNKKEIDSLTSKAIISSNISKTALSSLNEQLNKIQEIGGKTVTNEFSATQPIVDVNRAKDDLERLSTFQATALARQTDIQRSLSVATENTALKASEALGSIGNSIKTATEQLSVVSGNVGVSLEGFAAIGKAVASNTNAINENAAAVKAYGETLSNIQNFNDQSFAKPQDVTNKVIQGARPAIQAASNQIAETISGDITRALSGGLSKVVTDLKSSVEGILLGDGKGLIIIDIPGQVAKIKEAIRTAELKIDSFVIDKSKLQDQLNAGTPLSVPVTLNPVGTVGGIALPGKAGGGMINGPGSGTSDSILARLSNGEFVSDARTVGMFGPNFFHFLKSISNMGSSAVGSFMSVFGTIPFPRFFGGGLAMYGGLPGFAEGGLAPVAGQGIVPEMALNVSVNGRAISKVFGSRQALNNLASMIDELSKGVI